MSEQLPDDDDDGAPLPSLYEIELLLDAAKRDPNQGRAAAAYAAIQGMRAQADRYERDLIRSLRWDAKGNPIRGRTWEVIAELVNSQLGSRQAAWARWHLLTAKNRGEARRGRRPGGSSLHSE